MNFSELIQQSNRKRPADLRRQLRDVRPRPGGRLEWQGRSFLDFSSNDYLGLASHPLLIERSRQWSEQFGSGARASRLVSGNYSCLTELEEKLAAWKGRESSLIFGSGYQANGSVLTTLLDRHLFKDTLSPHVFSDRLCHASFHAGFAAAGTRQHRFRHNDLTHLRSLLEKHASAEAPCLIATESVFSMDGDQLDVDAIRKLAAEFDALLYVDEAHATGLFGDQGQGMMSSSDSTDQEIIIGTFGKAMGSYGASVSCAGEFREYLINRCGGMVYSTALPPTVLGAIDAALELVPKMQAERQSVLGLANTLREQLNKAGLDTLNSTTQIIPVVLGDNETTLRVANELAERGILVGAIRPPTVPVGAARLRISLSAAHDAESVSRLATAVIECQSRLSLRHK